VKDGKSISRTQFLYLIYSALLVLGHSEETIRRLNNLKLWKNLICIIVSELEATEMNDNAEFLLQLIAQIVQFTSNHSPLTIHLGQLLHERMYPPSSSLVPVVTEKEMQTFALLYNKLIPVLSNEISLSGYEIWLTIGVKGFGHYHSNVRKLIIEGFRFLVSLAPLGLYSLSKRNDYNSQSLVHQSFPLIQQLLARNKPPKICDSDDPCDRLIMKLLSDSMKSQNIATLCLRSYQWEGISWWTLLRRCGLSGILADEM
jgi:hypothetical protein